MELKNIHADGSHQGNSFGLVYGTQPWGHEVNLFWIEANDLKTWLVSEEVFGNQGSFSPAVHSAVDLTFPHGDPLVQSMEMWRR